MQSPWKVIKGLFARSNVDRELTAKVRQPADLRNKHLRTPVMSGMEPKRLAWVLREADAGNYEPYLIAAAELEERDGQYGPQIAIRRTAVAALELTVHQPGGATARAKKAAQELIDAKVLKPFISEALDALGKGFAITEIVWKEKHGKWVPICVPHEQVEFRWSDDHEAWRLRDHSYEGIELVPNKWVIHEPKLRSGIPIRRGLARPAMLLHMIKSMSLAGWVTLMRVFGVPLAIAKPKASGLSKNDVEVIRAALAGLGSGINAVVPDATEIQVIQAASAGATPEKMFSVLLEYVDKQISKLVLGQTMTADDGASHAQASVHNDVRKDIREGDAEDLAWTINEYVVKPYINFNVGEQKVYPEVYFAQPDTRDLKEWSEGLAPFIELGMPVIWSEVRAAFGLSDPGPDDEVSGGTNVEDEPEEGIVKSSNRTRRPRFAARPRFASPRRRPPLRQLSTWRSQSRIGPG